MIYVGIDVAKDKHDCCILTPDGEKISFSIQNDRSGFNTLLERILEKEDNPDKIKIGLESTGHFSQNILKFCNDSGISTFVINPLYAKDYRKCLLHRSTKTDKLDAYILANMLMSNQDLKPYCTLAYHNEEIKSLTRHRLFLIRSRALAKATITRLITLSFPELEKLVSDLHSTTVYTLLEAFPGAMYIAKANLTKLANLLAKASRGQFDKEKAIEIRNKAIESIGSKNSAIAFEIQQMIGIVRMWNQEIDSVEKEIEKYVTPEDLPLCSIPGVSPMAAATIMGEIGDIERFEKPDQLAAFAGLSPSTYQSGTIKNQHAHMEKKGSKYLRYILYITARQLVLCDPQYKAYFNKKRAEGKHYFVAMSHVMKRLIRLIFAMLKSGKQYQAAA